MISASCHCGDVRVTIPARPAEASNCNCSLCRRLGTLWAHDAFHAVQVEGHPARTEGYVQGECSLRAVRCRRCGCVTHWESLEGRENRRIGVNIRNFEPDAIGPVRIKLVDGADTWTAKDWEDR